MIIKQCHEHFPHNIKIENKYKDDVCFFYGDLAIYLNRHIIRAKDEVIKAFANQSYINNKYGRWSAIDYESEEWLKPES